MMRRRLALAMLAPLVAGALAGCATFEARLDPSLFGAPPKAAVELSPGAVRIVMPPDGSNLVVTTGGLRGFDANRVQLPAGEIITAAARLAFAHEFGGGVLVAPTARADAPDAPWPPTAAPWQVTVALGTIQFDFRDDFVYFLPLGPLTIERRDLTVRMALTVSVLDERGATTWSRSYDAGRELWKARGGALFPTETPAEGVQRLAHEQAYRLLARAAQDVRRFVEADRLRERVL
jgi:hypothetical protein